MEESDDRNRDYAEQGRREDQEALVELYPDLKNYLAIFDPEQSEIYPPPAIGESDMLTLDARRVAVPDVRRPLLKAAMILLIAAIIVYIFVRIGIRAIPNLEPS